MIKTIFFSITALVTIIGVAPFPGSKNYRHTQNNPGYTWNDQALASTAISANKAPTTTYCTCVDGSVYSYANSCKIGWVGCEPNACPPQPEGCNGE